MKQYNRQQEEKFIDYLEEYKMLILKIARVYSPDKESRKDLIQEIILQLWKSFSKYDNKYALSTWTYRIALNVSISQLRKAKTREKMISGYASHLNIMQVDDTTTNEKLEYLYLFIEKLKPIDKAITILYLEECSNKEIAAVTGLSESNISTRKLRIKKQLQSYFESYKSIMQ